MSEEQPQRTARLNIGPSRPGLSKRARARLLVFLLVALVVAIVVGAILASGKGGSGTPMTLRQAAAKVHFHPTNTSAQGKLEDDPLPSPVPRSASDALPPGTKAPPFTLPTPTGVRVSLASLRGKAVLIELFATWCPHCSAEAPHLKKLYARLPHGRYAFVSINADGEDAPSIFAYHEYFKLPFPALVDPNPSDPGSFHHEGSPGPVSKAYRIKLFPTFYVLDAKGRVAWAATGEQPDALLLHELQAAAG